MSFVIVDVHLRDLYCLHEQVVCHRQALRLYTEFSFDSCTDLSTSQFNVISQPTQPHNRLINSAKKQLHQVRYHILHFQHQVKMSQTHSTANHKALVTMLHIYTAGSSRDKKSSNIDRKVPNMSTPVKFRSLQAKLFFEGK
jgi:hypothetical protein